MKRDVIISERVTSGQQLVFGYSYRDLQALFGYPALQHIYEGIKQGQFDPADLESVCLWYMQRIRRKGFKRTWKQGGQPKVLATERAHGKRVKTKLKLGGRVMEFELSQDVVDRLRENEG